MEDSFSHFTKKTENLVLIFPHHYV